VEDTFWKILWETELLAPPLSMIPAESVFLHEEQDGQMPSLTATVEGVPALLVCWEDVLGGGDIYVGASTHTDTVEESRSEEVWPPAFGPQDLLCTS
jgi:hypothetical protein